jgi:uncharacterized protein (DUF2267 family)
MQYKDFIAEIRRELNFNTESEAVSAVKAVFQTLAERLQGNETKHIAAQLPEELKGFLDYPGKGESFSLNEFYRRVSEKEGVPDNQAPEHTMKVFSVLGNAVTQGEMNHIKDQLPEEYFVLFENIPSGQDKG